MGIETSNEKVRLAQAVLSNAIDFLNVGLTILFSPKCDEPRSKGRNDIDPVGY